MNEMRRFGMLGALAAAAPFLGVGPDPWSFRPRKEPRWRRLGYESEAAYLKRVPPKPEKAEDKPE